MGVFRTVWLSALVAMYACGDHPPSRFVKSGERVVIEVQSVGAQSTKRDGPFHELAASSALLVGVPVRLRTRAVEMGNEYGCEGASSACGGRSNDHCVSPTSAAVSRTMEADLEAADCRTPGCTAVIGPSPGEITLTATKAGPVTLAVAVRKRAGSGQVASDLTVTFDDVASIEVVRQLELSPMWLENAILPDEKFAWCANAVGTSGQVLRDAEVEASGVGTVEATGERTEGAPHCPIFRTKSVGRGSVVFTAGGVTRTLDVEVVGEDSVVAVEMIDPRPWFTATQRVSGEDVIATAPTLGPVTVRRSDHCVAYAAARFRTPDGRTGMTTRETFLVATPDSLLVRWRPTQTNVLRPHATFDVRGGPGSGTFTASLAGHTAVVQVTVEDCQAD
jgi:hypothetical protein